MHRPTLAGATATAAAVVMSGLGVAVASPTSASAVDCDPGSFASCQRVSYTGADQTWTVPPGVTSIAVEMWGAGGGGTPFFDLGA